MTLAAPLNSPLYFAAQGGATLGVPDKFDISIAGRGYMIDTVSDSLGPIPNYSIETVALIRGQADQSKRPGEQSLNPEDFWRRSQETWTGGAGQTWYDREFSYDGRFRRSKGIDPWTRGELSLLHDTELSLDSANATILLAVAGTRLYAIDGSALKYTTNLTSWTAATAAGGTLSSPTSICSDGKNVWACDATDLYYTTTSVGTYDEWHSTPFVATLVRHVKGRLISANGASLYNNSATQGSAVPTPFYTHPNSAWTWVDITEGPSAIYAAGYCGDKSLIYRTAVRADGVQLDIPIVAGELPDGEIVRSIQGYLGFLLIGTDMGIRFATLDAQGAISALGDSIEITNGVRCFEPQDRFVWFGWKDYDSYSTGLGRVDLRTFNGTAPAYATDLMAGNAAAGAIQGTPLSVVTFNNKRVFSISGSGVWAESTDLIYTGSVDSGYITYGLADPKTAVKLATRHKTGQGVYTAYLATDEKAAVQLGGTINATATSSGGVVLPAPSNARGEFFEIQLNLYRYLTNAESGPTITRWTLRADAGASRRLKIAVPIRLARSVETRTGATETYNVAQERRQIEALMSSRQIVSFQEGSSSRSVIVEDFQWQPFTIGPVGNPDWQGTMLVLMKTV